MFRSLKNRFSGSEDTMVKLFIAEFGNKELIFGQEFVKGDFYEQVRVPEIKRRSDLVIKCGPRRLINVEFKLGDWKCLLSQCIDHLKWADYSYACLPVNFLRVYPQSFCSELLTNNIGLVVGTSNTFIEVFRAKHNTYKSGKSKSIRTNVLSSLDNKYSRVNNKPCTY